MPTAIECTVPIRTVSIANRREHWAVRLHRTRRERAAVSLALRPLLTGVPTTPPALVRLTRIAPRRLDDDNLAAALKSIRDQVASELGISDGPGGPEWQVAQERGGVRSYAVRLEIFWSPS